MFWHSTIRTAQGGWRQESSNSWPVSEWLPMPKDIECHVRQTSRPSRSLASNDYLGSCSLDMIAPITEGPLPSAGGLLVFWDDVTIAELPKTVRIYAESQNAVTPVGILNSLVSPS